MKVIFSTIFCVFIFLGQAKATELVYTPINPSFGGSGINGGFLLSKAEAQNKLKEESFGYERDPLKDFKDLLTRRVLSGMAGEILDAAFGEEADLGEGHYEFGDYAIDVVNVEGVDITVNITDLLTGQMTTVTVPYIQ